MFDFNTSVSSETIPILSVSLEEAEEASGISARAIRLALQAGYFSEKVASKLEGSLSLQEPLPRREKKTKERLPLERVDALFSVLYELGVQITPKEIAPLFNVHYATARTIVLKRSRPLLEGIRHAAEKLHTDRLDGFFPEKKEEMAPASEFSTSLKRERNKAGLSQKQLAEKISTSTFQISHLESGSRQPSPRIQAAILEALPGVSVPGVAHHTAHTI